MELSAGGSIIHCPCPPYITLWKISCELTERDSPVDSYCPVDNNTPYSRRGSILSFSNRKALQASPEGLAVELFFWAFYWRGADVEEAGEWGLEPMISGRFWKSQLQTHSPI